MHSVKIKWTVNLCLLLAIIKFWSCGPYNILPEWLCDPQKEKEEKEQIHTCFIIYVEICPEPHHLVHYKYLFQICIMDVMGS